MMANRLAVSGALALALIFGTRTAEAQETALGDPLAPAVEPGADPRSAAEAVGGEFEIVYEREVFRYPRDGRADPFRSLLLDDDLGIRVEDLTLRGTVHHPDPSLSVAIMTLTGSDRRIQARIGERVGPMRVLAIYPDRVDIVIEELGVARRETLRIIRPEQREQGR
jgi:hypothetical protein